MLADSFGASHVQFELQVVPVSEACFIFGNALSRFAALPSRTPMTLRRRHGCAFFLSLIIVLVP